MTNYKISQLTALANPQQNVIVPVVDPNDMLTNPHGANGSDKKVTWGQVAAGASADIARVFIAGHSYPSGDQNTVDGENYPRRLCAALGAEEVLYVKTGAILAMDVSANAPANPQGYPNVFNALTPRTFYNGTWTTRNSPPYLPVSPVTVFNYGGNDLQALTSTAATNIAWYKMALTACCCIARAGGYFPDTDASVAYSSGWSAVTGDQNYGWPTSHTATATTKTVTITVPSAFPGGEIDLLTVARGSGGTKWSTVVDGGGAQVLDGTSSAYGPASGGHGNLVVQRLTGLAAGTHTIVMTVSALDASATACFEGWLIAAPQPPLVVLVNQPLFPALPLSGGTHTPVTTTDETNLNAGTAAVAALFTDGNVVVADIATAFAAVTAWSPSGGNVATGSAGSLYAADNIHPNSAGHGLIAATIRDAIRSAPLPGGIARFAAEGLYARVIGGPLEPSLNSPWNPVNYQYFGKDRAGNTFLKLSVVRTGMPSGSETVVTLPVGYQPEPLAGLYFGAGTAWASGYTSATAAGIGAAGDGEIVWTFGDPTTEWDVAGMWFGGGLGS